jgi:hypothetical protein
VRCMAELTHESDSIMSGLGNVKTLNIRVHIQELATCGAGSLIPFFSKLEN